MIPTFCCPSCFAATLGFYIVAEKPSTNSFWAHSATFLLQLIAFHLKIGDATLRDDKDQKLPFETLRIKEETHSLRDVQMLQTRTRIEVDK